MIFDFALGNPPFQGEAVGGQKNKRPPVYNLFMEGAYKVADKVELITPARFLFNAGDTPKEWNEKMLNDEHLKVLKYEPDAQKVFPSTSFKGGVAITLRDSKKELGPIGVFTSYPELNSIMEKIKTAKGFSSFSSIIANRGLYRFSNAFYKDFPQASDLLSDPRIFSGAFERLPFAFCEKKPAEKGEYVAIFGLVKNLRTTRYILRKYVNNVKSLENYKVFIPKSNGSGAIGEVLSTPLVGEPLVGEPLVGHTETFLSIGNFANRTEAENCMKYIKTKFARTALGILKITQDNPPDKWQYVPMQDFSAFSDIDWTGPISEIDKQLYHKYGLSEREVCFIESKVKEMH